MPLIPAVVSPELRAIRITDCSLSSLVDSFGKIAKLDLGEPTITDQGSVEITVRATGGGTAKISVYALGIGDEYVTPEQAANRKQLSSVLAQLDSVLAGGRKWTADRLQVIDGYQPTAQPTLTWPKSVPFKLKAMTAAYRCGVVEFADATKVSAAMGAGPGPRSVERRRQGPLAGGQADDARRNRVPVELSFT